MSINYDRYLKVCRQAVEDERVFNTFKSNPDYTWVLEHVTPAQGKDYLDEIKKIRPELLDMMKVFASNDLIGNPALHYYEDINMFMSPTTLRYVKVLADLKRMGVSLYDMDIVEIGGGYGGQCKIIYDVCKPRSYTIIDLPDVLELATKYLKAHNISITARMPNDAREIKYDVFISNYAFTEIDRKSQEFYIEHVINHCKLGYMTCNFVDIGDKLSKKEILSLHVDGVALETPEVPLTSPNNFIYAWNRLDTRSEV